MEIQKSKFAFLITISSISIFLSSCRNFKKQEDFNIGSIKVTKPKDQNDFLFGKSICYYAQHKEFKKIDPPKIWNVDEPTETQIRGFVIGDSLKIYQGGIVDKKDSVRRWYVYKNKPLEVIRIYRDSDSDSSFGTVFFHFADSERLYRKNGLLLFSNTEARSTGMADIYRFIQVFDLPNMRCYEFWVNLKDCGEYPLKNE